MIQRAKLLKLFSVKNLSESTQLKASEKFKNMTDVQKEEMAGKMLTMLKNSKTEKEFLSKMEEIY